PRRPNHAASGPLETRGRLVRLCLELSVHRTHGAQLASHARRLAVTGAGVPIDPGGHRSGGRAVPLEAGRRTGVQPGDIPVAPPLVAETALDAHRGTLRRGDAGTDGFGGHGTAA